MLYLELASLQRVFTEIVLIFHQGTTILAFTVKSDALSYKIHNNASTPLCFLKTIQCKNVFIFLIFIYVLIIIVTLRTHIDAHTK